MGGGGGGYWGHIVLCKSCRHLCCILSALYHLNLKELMDFDPACTDTLLGKGKELVSILVTLNLRSSSDKAYIFPS